MVNQRFLLRQRLVCAFKSGLALCQPPICRVQVPLQFRNSRNRVSQQWQLRIQKSPCRHQRDNPLCRCRDVCFMGACMLQLCDQFCCLLRQFFRTLFQGSVSDDLRESSRKLRACGSEAVDICQRNPILLQNRQDGQKGLFHRVIRRCKEKNPTFCGNITHQAGRQNSLRFSGTRRTPDIGNRIGKRSVDSLLLLFGKRVFQ